MMNMVGHADLRTTLRYTVTDDDRQREGLENLSFKSSRDYQI